MSFGSYPGGRMPTPIGNPRMVNPGAGALRPGPAPLPPRMQPPAPPRSMPPRMQPPRPVPAPRPMPQPPVAQPPMPMPDLPYGGPITMPGGPFTPRPDMGPGVGFGPGLPQPGMPTPGMPGGKSAPMPGPGVLPPGFDDTFTDGPQMIGGAYGQPIYGGRPNPMPPNMYNQPNFASALDTQSPFLNSVQR